MKQEGSARRRGADKAKPPPGGGEQEPPVPPAPQDVEMKEEATAGSGSTGDADGKTATATEHSQRELDTITLEGTEVWTGDGPRSASLWDPSAACLHRPWLLRIGPKKTSRPTTLPLPAPAPITPGSGLPLATRLHPAGHCIQDWVSLGV